ncbi:MAG: DUF3806 domain-containing protein [Anaerolineae bacterium]|nr:DUF3806 domain-containing protein [Anaerolineae bacterium]
MVTGQKILELTADDSNRLNEQRAVVEQFLLSEDLVEKYKTAAGKITLLQALIQGRFISADQTYGLQCMGIVLGDVFVMNMGFHWIMVEDEYGRDPAIRYQNTSIILHPLTMISKRVEKGEEINIDELYNGISAIVNDLVEQVSK